MKKINPLFFILLIILIITSCSTSDRKYTDGFYLKGLVNDFNVNKMNQYLDFEVNRPVLENEIYNACRESEAIENALASLNQFDLLPILNNSILENELKKYKPNYLVEKVVNAKLKKIEKKAKEK